MRDQANSVGHEASLADWPPLFPVLLLQVRAAGAAQASSVSGTQAAEGGRAGSCWGQARTMEPTAFQGAVVDASVVCRKKNAASFAYVDSVQVSSDSLDCLSGFQ